MTVSSKDLLESVCEGGTYMIFLYGDLPDTRFIKLHDSHEPKEEASWPILLKDVEDMLEYYCFFYHSNFVNYKGDKTQVYVANRSAQKRKFKKESWIKKI